MIIHKLYYGPEDGKGLTLKTSEGIREIVNDDIIMDRYSIDAKRKPIFDSKIFYTPHGPVLSLSRVEPCSSSDNRATFMNHTIFVALGDVVQALSHFLMFDMLDMQPVVTSGVESGGCQP